MLNLQNSFDVTLTHSQELIHVNSDTKRLSLNKFNSHAFPLNSIKQAENVEFKLDCDQPIPILVFKLSKLNSNVTTIGQYYTIYIIYTNKLIRKRDAVCGE
jgi:hypothetical protein